MEEKFMKEALKEAMKSYEKAEVPIGAIIVKDGKIIGRGHNLKEEKMNSLCHAEIMAINKACKKLKNWRLNNCTMYVTLEPCPMCAGAINEARIDNIVIGTMDKDNGACGSKINILNENIKVTSGILTEESKDILQKFFKELRSQKKKK